MTAGCHRRGIDIAAALTSLVRDSGSGDQVTNALASFATFGVGFGARPGGAILFGWLGDRIRRRPALLITVVMIGLATGLIGLLPDFSAIGNAAPVLLVLLRLLQGIAVGGEWSSGNATSERVTLAKDTWGVPVTPPLRRLHDLELIPECSFRHPLQHF
ncbi:MFS transporter [Streptomyces sp. YU58]|uniref:MFS transporter n=1 Tax=Streptomyces sp. SX92 TaxID=3158972 RepID=UPI0027B8FA66|nr:MFS transporter [Streptomyces coralus]WLW50303.1 MFS transporter [Streptomyces coralus]